MKFKNQTAITQAMDFFQVRKRYESESRIFINNYCDLSYFKINNGKKLTFVFFHGFNGGKFDALKWMIESPDYNYLSFDMPGYRKSKINNNDFSDFDADKYVDAIIELIDLEITGEIILIGHSLGCYIAAKTSIRLKNLHRLILIAPVTENIADYHGAKLQYLMLDSVSSLKHALSELTNKPLIKPRFFFNTLLWIQARKFRKNRKINRILLSKTEEYAANKIFKKTYESVVVPSAIICGAVDKIILEKWMTDVQKQLKTESLNIIKESGHLPYMEKLSDFSELINKLVKTL